MARRKQGRRIKRKTQKETDTSDQASELPPRAFVFSKGKVSAPLKALVNDLKGVMSPNTARALKAQRRNKIKDFVDVAGSLHVSFFLIVSSTEQSSYLRLVRSPRGPTLTFRIRSYALAADLAATLRRPYSAGNAVWQSNPLLVLSDFDQSQQEQSLAATMLRNLFPPINVQTLQISACRRIVMLHQRPAEEGGGVELRQYVIKAAPTNVSRGAPRSSRSGSRQRKAEGAVEGACCRHQEADARQPRAVARPVRLDGRLPGGAGRLLVRVGRRDGRRRKGGPAAGLRRAGRGARRARVRLHGLGRAQYTSRPVSRRCATNVWACGCTRSGRG